MIGKTISHYKILEKLGGGGMGVVYKAEDTKLKRTVALKFLPPAFSLDEEAKQRFINEAQAASSFDHPNICTIHEINETEDGQLFIAMAYYKGETLKKKIEKGPIKIEDAIDIVSQVAEGLRRAHKKEIVHRDIKPANIFITNDGVIKILDFGLAKVSAQTQITTLGTTMGTIAYMSPEQTKGEEVDQRTDIWSLGVVMYEMLTGELPFKGDYEQAVIYSIMNEDPEPMMGLRTGVPMELEHIVTKALKKNPTGRYQHIDEMLVDLKSVSRDSDAGKDRALSKPTGKTPLTIGLIFLVALVVASGFFYWWQTPSSSPGPSRDSVQRLAVLPFTNIRKDPATDFLGFALADQIIGSLSYLQNILVRPSSSIRRYQDQTLDRQTAGADLKVDIILTGNYLKEANTIRLNIELVDVDANEMIWREPIEVEYENTFTLQDIVSAKVITRLKLQFSQDERARMQSDVSQNPLAYEYYLRSISYPSTSEGDLLAIEMLTNSIQLDSSYAPTFAELGYRRQQYGNYGLAGAQEISKAEQAYLRALSLNEELLDALQNLSTLYTETARTEKAVELARRMLTINPNNASAHFSLGYVYRYAGMLEESEKEYDRALAIDPGNPRFRSAGITYNCLGKYEKAIQAFNLDKGSSLAFLQIGMIFYRREEKQKAIEIWNALLAQEPTGVLSFLGTAMKALVEGETETARTAMTELEQANPADAEIWFSIAEIYGLLGDAVSSARTLEEGVNRGYFNYPFMVSDSFFDQVRSAPEFQGVLEMAKARHETFKVRFFSE
ncbi:MAG: protein kinase [Bacteroidetes bacterium]|nr:protein kinase [Bacteroidota bacterium]